MSEQLGDEEIGGGERDAARATPTARAATRGTRSATADAPTATTRTAPTRTTRTAPTPTRTQKTRASGALARCVEPIDAAEFLAEYWEQQPLAVAAVRGGSFRRPALGRRRRAAGLLGRAARARPSGSSRKAARSPSPTTRPTSPGGRSPSPARSTRTGSRPRSSDGATIVLQGLHLNWPPLARFCRAARSRARPARAGELVLHAAPLAGLRRPPRHARRLRPPGRGREALAGVRPPARAAAEGQR